MNFPYVRLGVFCSCTPVIVYFGSRVGGVRVLFGPKKVPPYPRLGDFLAQWAPTLPPMGNFLAQKAPTLPPGGTFKPKNGLWGGGGKIYDNN